MQDKDMFEALLGYFTIDNGLFVVIAYIGMLSHAYKKYAMGDLRGSVFNYIFKNNWKRTILAVGTTFVACAGAIIGEQVPPQIGAFLGFAWTLGYSFDSLMNKED